MKAAKARGKHLGRPPIRRAVVAEIEALAASTDLSIRQIYEKIGGKASRGGVGEITKRIRSGLCNDNFDVLLTPITVSGRRVGSVVS